MSSFMLGFAVFVSALSLAAPQMRIQPRRLCSLNASVARKGCSSQVFKQVASTDSELPDGEIITVSAKRFRCAEVLLLPNTHELRDDNIVTVRVKRFRFAGSVVP